MRHLISFWLLALIVQPVLSKERVNGRDIHELNKLLGRGINLSGLEQAVEGDWLNNQAFKIIADGGFDSVRIPIKWDSRALALGSDESGNYVIEPAFFERVDGVVADALAAGLRVIINMHHYEDLINHPELEVGRFLNLWDQVAKHYAKSSDFLYFEILNEPAGVFSDQPERWNDLQGQALQIIRQSNSDRAVMVAPVGWNNIESLPMLHLPVDDYLIVTVHYYDPGSFTHQGAEWVEPVMPVGVEWFPQTLRLGADLQNWSWDTDVQFYDDNVEVIFSRSGAAFNVYQPSDGKPLSVNVDVSGSAELAVICGKGGKFFDTKVRITHDGESWQTYSADLSDCPDMTNQIAFQNLREAPKQTLRFRAGELCDSGGCVALFTSKVEAIELAFDSARLWGERNKRPMNLGEFGAYDKGDIQSRIRWTQAVQRSAKSRGMSTHYWEFEQGFGVWDADKEEWIEGLYRSLVVDED